MKESEVPQDNIPYYEGHSKLVYAQKDTGEITGVESSGWETEEFVTRQVVDELERLAAEALTLAQNGAQSPLAYHMYNSRHDLLSLSQTSGYWQWRIKRHFKPQVFAKLSDKKLQPYAEAIGISIEQLRTIPN